MGSPNGLWTSVSGGIAQNQNIDNIANNIANSNTIGFKKDQAVFKEYLTAMERNQDPVVDIPRTAFKDSDFYHHEGREHAMVNYDKNFTDHDQGHLKMTGSPLDLAIDGEGLFAVQSPTGVIFTRAGNFKLNEKGFLVTNQGYPVLTLDSQTLSDMDAANQAAKEAASGAVPQNAQNPNQAQNRPNPFANVNRTLAQETPGAAKAPTLKPVNLIEYGSQVRISENGRIYSGETLVAGFALADVKNKNGLQKIGSNFYKNSDPENFIQPSQDFRIKQGFVEESNVNTVSELVELIKANRLFESNMRAIKVYNDMAGKEANEVGKL